MQAQNRLSPKALPSLFTNQDEEDKCEDQIVSIVTSKQLFQIQREESNLRQLDID